MASVLHDHFDGTDIDRTVWLPHYLPAWSSLDRSAASWVVHDSALTLHIATVRRSGHPG